MSFGAIIRAVKRACLDFVMRQYRYYRRGKFLRAVNLRDHEYVKLYRWVGGKLPVEAIEIETVNRCNGICPFCPVNVNQPQREYAKMTEELFRKIIDDLASMNYSRVVSLYSNNEPFIDERIIDFHKYANEKLPNAVFLLYTMRKYTPTFRSIKS